MFSANLCFPFVPFLAKLKTWPSDKGRTSWQVKSANNKTQFFSHCYLVCWKHSPKFSFLLSQNHPWRFLNTWPIIRGNELRSFFCDQKGPYIRWTNLNSVDTNKSNANRRKIHYSTRNLQFFKKFTIYELRVFHSTTQKLRNRTFVFFSSYPRIDADTPFP